MMRQEKGVTLVELMIAVAIIAVFAAIAVPNYREYLPKSRVNGAARELVTEMQLIRMKAVSANNNYMMVFATSYDGYIIYNDRDNDSNVSDTHEIVKTFIIPDRYKGIGFGYVPGNNPSGNPITGRVTFSGSKVTFEPTGLASTMGAVYLIPQEDIAAGRKDRQRAITVILSGRVRLYAHNGTSWQ